MTPEALAKVFHDTYERLAPSYNYQTRKESAVDWKDVPAINKHLMIAVAGEVLKVMQQMKHEETFLQYALSHPKRVCVWLAESQEATHAAFQEMRNALPVVFLHSVYYHPKGFHLRNGTHILCRVSSGFIANWDRGREIDLLVTTPGCDLHDESFRYYLECGRARIVAQATSPLSHLT